MARPAHAAASSTPTEATGRPPAPWTASGLLGGHGSGLRRGWGWLGCVGLGRGGLAARGRVGGGARFPSAFDVLLGRVVDLARTTELLAAGDGGAFRLHCCCCVNSTANVVGIQQLPDCWLEVGGVGIHGEFAVKAPFAVLLLEEANVALARFQLRPRGVAGAVVAQCHARFAGVGVPLR